MFYIPPPQSRDRLIQLLASKTGLSAVQAGKFLDALTEMTMSGEIQELSGVAPSTTHLVSIPLVEQEDGTLTVDTSGRSFWFPFPWWRRRRRPPTPRPGGYPGPSVKVIRVKDWLAKDMKLDQTALQRLIDWEEEI